MAHGWGGDPDDDADLAVVGSPVNRLVDDEARFDPITGIPVQTAIPVNLTVTGP